MALRHGKFFGNGAEIWMGLQADFDLWTAREVMKAELAKIKPAEGNATQATPSRLSSEISGAGRC